MRDASLGVATQDELLEKRFTGRPEHIINYFRFVAEELRQIMSQLGMRKLDEMIGQTQLLEQDSAILPWKAKGLDLAKIVYRPDKSKGAEMRCTVEQEHGLGAVLDVKLMELAAPALNDRIPVKIELPVMNSNRTAGAMLSGAVCRRFGEGGLAEDTIRCKFTGCAGQSFAAFLAQGVTFELEGLANDYVGKGISGGKVIIYPDRETTFSAHENMVIGNTTFYGAIAGQAYIRGRAGERFCIRNSGLYGVVEGVGDHGCEYMTGGRIVVLGKTGKNFAAGMSGGIAYIYDREGNFTYRCNTDMVALEKPDEEDIETIRNLLINHYRATHSPLARRVLDYFANEVKDFVKVMPFEYKRILEEQKARRSEITE